jgi:hypothetical protein
MKLRSYFVETLFLPHKVTLGSRALPGKPMFYLSRGPTRSLLSWSFAIKTTEHFFCISKSSGSKATKKIDMFCEKYNKRINIIVQRRDCL